MTHGLFTLRGYWPRRDVRWRVYISEALLTETFYPEVVIQVEAERIIHQVVKPIERVWINELIWWVDPPEVRPPLTLVGT